MKTHECYHINGSGLSKNNAGDVIVSGQQEYRRAANLGLSNNAVVSIKIVWCLYSKKTTPLLRRLVIKSRLGLFFSSAASVKSQPCQATTEEEEGGRFRNDRLGKRCSKPESVVVSVESIAQTRMFLVTW